MEVREVSVSYAGSNQLPIDAVPFGYTQTEVGMIPGDWRVANLGALSRGIYRGASPRPIDDPVWFDSNSNVGWVRISDVTQSGRYLTETTQRLSSKGIQSSRYLPSGALIMSICATVGRPVETRIDVCIHDGFVVFDRPSVEQSFLYHLLKKLEPDWSSRGQTGSQMNLNTGLIKSTQVPLPPSKAEQRAIAEALSDADALIESLEQLIAKKRQIKQGTMQALLTGKQRMPGFNDEWHKCYLADLVAFHKGKGLPKSALDAFAKTPCIHYGELFTKYAETIREVTSYTGQVTDAIVSYVQDVLMPTSDVTPTGLAKASCVTMQDVVIGGDILVIRPDTSRLYGPFLSYVIRYSKQQILQLVTGSTVFHIYASDMKKFTLAVPSIKEQEQIIRVLDDMDTELADLEARLAKTRLLKQGMMQELLTGRIRLV